MTREEFNVQEAMAKVKISITKSLDALLTNKAYRSTKKEMALATQKMLAHMEADLCGVEPVSCDILWNTFTLKEKAKWLLYNVVIPSKGQVERLKVDLRNEKASYEQSMAEIDAKEEAFGDDVEELHYSYTDREKYPSYAIPNPKHVISMTTRVKLRTAIQFVPLSVQLDNAKVENE